jgi:hypothetical protein
MSCIWGLVVILPWIGYTLYPDQILLYLARVLPQIDDVLYLETRGPGPR